MINSGYSWAGDRCGYTGSCARRLALPTARKERKRPLVNAKPSTSALSWLRRTISTPIASIAAVLIALLIGALLIQLLGKDALAAYRALLEGAVGNLNSLAETLLKAIPLTLAGVGVTIAFRANVFNVGAEGQLFCVRCCPRGSACCSAINHRYIVIPAMMLAATRRARCGRRLRASSKRRSARANSSTRITLNYIAILSSATCCTARCKTRTRR